jgi:hypothetical protein
MCVCVNDDAPIALLSDGVELIKDHMELNAVTMNVYI